MGEVSNAQPPVIRTLEADEPEITEISSLCFSCGETVYKIY